MLCIGLIQHVDVEHNPPKNQDSSFSKSCIKCPEQTFYIENQAIDVVQDYTYLGTKISSSGNFKISPDHLKEKALHTHFSLRRHTNFKVSLYSFFLTIPNIFIWPFSKLPGLESM